MDTTEVAANGTSRTRRSARSIKRAFILGLAVTAMATAFHPTSTRAADVGGGYAYESVYCNSSNHTITVATQSWGILTGGVLTSSGGIFFTPLTYRVWTRVREYANGKWVVSAWNLAADGSFKTTFAAPAGQISYWYFDWGFEYAPNKVTYVGEYAGNAGTYGIYGDQRGYRTLASCLT